MNLGNRDNDLGLGLRELIVLHRKIGPQMEAGNLATEH